MVINIEKGYTLDVKAIKNMLLTIYNNKPSFPIEDEKILIEALGGKNQLLFINENLGDIPVTTIVDKILKEIDAIKDPNQIIDGIIGDSFVDIITKFKLLDTIYNLDFPINSKDDFISQTKQLIIYGIPIETLAEKLDYPIEKSEKIINRIKLLDKKLLDANVELITNLKEGEPVESGEIIEEHSDSLEEIVTAISDKEMSLKDKIKFIIEHGKNAYRESNYKKALEIYEKGLELDQDNTELNFLKKSMQQKIDDLENPPSEQESDKIEETRPLQEDTADMPVEEPSEQTSEIAEKTIESEPEIKTDDKSESITETVDDQLSIEEQSKKDLDILKGAEQEVDSLEEKDIEDEDIPSETEDKTQFDKLEMDNKIEELGKRLQEKVSILKNLSTTSKELPEDACKSCEGKGDCYWCNGSGKCKTCSGSGKDESGNDCEECTGSGSCHSCNGVGKCHWCNGSGKKKS